MSRPMQKGFGADFWCEVCRPWKWLWVDSNGKNWNYTSRAVGNEFPSICNHCGVTAAWSRKIWKKMSFLSFYGKTTPNGKIFKIRFQKFSSRNRSTCCVQISLNLADGKVVKSCIIYLSKNSPGSSALATARIAPKIYRNQPPDNVLRVPRFRPNRFTFISGVISERVNAVRACSKVNGIIFGWSLASSQIIRPKGCLLISSLSI